MKKSSRVYRKQVRSMRRGYFREPELLASKLVEYAGSTRNWRWFDKGLSGRGFWCDMSTKIRAQAYQKLARKLGCDRVRMIFGIEEHLRGPRPGAFISPRLDNIFDYGIPEGTSPVYTWQTPEIVQTAAGPVQIIKSCYSEPVDLTPYRCTEV